MRLFRWPLVFATDLRKRADKAAKEAESADPIQPSLLKAGDVKEITLNGVKYRFRYCPAGSFTMGSPASEEGRSSDEVQHKVTLSRSYWMLETEVTQEMWRSAMGNNPSRFKGDKLPVETVSWNDCQEFISKLNASSKSSGMEFRLPTEAEWEYACRAESTSAYPWGDSCNGRKANCNGNYPFGTWTEGPYKEKTTPVGSYAANRWGLTDMVGNVWEWCSDWYDAYPTGAVVDPIGASNTTLRVLRGGCWRSNAVECRSATRYNFVPANYDHDSTFSYFGFRLACSSIN